MSGALNTVSPFFQRQVTPPPMFPLLTCQTDVLYWVPCPLRLLSQETVEITAKQPTTLRRQPSHSRPPGNQAEMNTTSRGPAGPRTIRFSTRERSPSSSELSSMDEDDMVEKPRGEFGRPNSGGYSLGPATLGWGKKRFEQFRVCFH
jgi:hypothetical protein